MNIFNFLNHSKYVLKNHGMQNFVNFFWFKFFTLKTLPLTVCNYPVMAHIETTNICNLKCKMCAHSMDSWKSHHHSKSLTLEEFKIIIDQLPFVHFALLNGVGEPLLNMELGGMVKYANSKGIKTGFFTNATLLTEEKSLELVNSVGLSHINVSIDAGTSALYKKIRIGASLEEVFKNVENFIRIRNETGKFLPELTVFMVPFSENIREIPQLIKRIKELGCNRLRLHGVLQPEGLDIKRISEEEYKLLKEYQRDGAKKNFFLLLEQITGGSFNRVKKRACVEPWRTVYVNASGNINPCCYSFFDNEAYLGNIFDNSMKEIWNGQAFKIFRNKLKNGMPACCSKCPAYNRRFVYE